MESWDDLKFFLAVARTGGLSKAAAQLGTSVSTVFRHVEALEKSLATHLFDRRPRGYLLTPAGETLLELAGTIEVRVDEARRQLSGADLLPEGVVRVTAPPDLAASVLVDMLLAFRDAYPRITLELNSTGKRLSLSDREADVALRAGPPPAEPDVVARKIADVAAAVYGSRRYLDRHGRPETHADLARHDLILASGPFASLPAVREFEQHAGDRAPRFRCGSFAEQKQFARAGFGLALLPCMLCGDAPELVSLFDPEPGALGGLWIAVHGDLRNLARVRAVVDFAWEALIHKRPQIEGKDVRRA